MPLPAYVMFFDRADSSFFSRSTSAVGRPVWCGNDKVWGGFTACPDSFLRLRAVLRPLKKSFVAKDFRFMWKYTFVIPIQVAKVYLFFICQFSIIRIVRMVCSNDLFLMRANRIITVIRAIADCTGPLTSGCYHYSKEKSYEFQVSRHINEVHDADRE